MWTAFLRKNSRRSVVLVVLMAVLTPFCSCASTAVILAMLTSTVPWGPIVAFMVASPLSSPSEFAYLAGFFGFRFAAFQRRSWVWQPG